MRRPLVLLAALLLLQVPATLAQTNNNPDEGGPGPGNGATAVPIDGGASLLLLAGASLGVARLRRRSR